MSAVAPSAANPNVVAIVSEFAEMAIEIHCHHSGRSKLWDPDNLNDWKSCKYAFCRRRYELLEELTASQMDCSPAELFITQ